MVQASDSLIWLCVRNNNSFLKKKNGSTTRSGSIHFSTEKGNLYSISSFKYSGLAQSKTVDISCVEGDDSRAKAVLSTKTAKASSTPCKGSAATPINKNFRRVEKTITSQTAANYYRQDLKSAALAKWSAVYRANRNKNGVTKVVPVKKGRGKL